MQQRDRTYNTIQSFLHLRALNSLQRALTRTRFIRQFHSDRQSISKVINEFFSIKKNKKSRNRNDQRPVFNKIKPACSLKKRERERLRQSKSTGAALCHLLHTLETPEGGFVNRHRIHTIVVECTRGRNGQGLVSTAQ